MIATLKHFFFTHLMTKKNCRLLNLSDGKDDFVLFELIDLPLDSITTT